MRICVIGCGGIGSVFAAHLARVETLEVFAYDVWREHVKAINEMLNSLIEESGAVARALGIELHHDPKDAVRARAQAPGKHKASMVQDVLASRATEIDFLNGAIVRWGEQAGVPTPLNRTLWALIKGLEHSWTDP